MEKRADIARGAGHDASQGAFAWEGPAIGLLDLDAFFASVEQLDHPEWRGKPLIVGGSAGRRGVVSTCSYEARRFGVHSAMPSWQAERLCPDAIWTQGHYDRYREMSAAVMSVLYDETPLVEQVSIDEAFFDVSPGRFSRESPVDICRRVQSRVSELGITCSIGLGVNKTVAKIASEREKPRGLTIVFPGTQEAFLAPLPVSAMSGIGQATERCLHEIGIRTLGELARTDPQRLARTFGVVGPRMAVRAAGLEQSAVADAALPEEAKSVSNERTFNEDITRREDALAAVMHVAAITGRRLRKKGLKGTTVTLRVKYDACHARTAQRSLAHPTDDELEFGPVAQELLDEVWTDGMPLRLVGVGLSGFGEKCSRPEQLGLFDAKASGGHVMRDRSALSKVTDSLRDRFGDEALAYGRDLRLRDRVSDTTPMNKDDA